MTARIRKFVLAAIVLVNAGAIWLILAHESDYRVNLDSVLEIWADFVRDADKIGLTVTRISAAEEIEIGDDMMPYYSVELGTPLARYVNEVGQHVAENARRKNIPYRFHVLDSSEINAYAIPGGHVFITKPMLGLIKSEAELASILGHEIAHIDLRHCIERLQYEIRARQVLGSLAVIVRLAHDLVDVAYSKQQESEADRTGMLLMAEAGYSPIESLGIFVRLQSELESAGGHTEKTAGPEGEVIVALEHLLRDYFRTHPRWADRVSELQTLLEQNEAAWSKTAFCTGTTNYQNHVPCFKDQRPGESVTISPAAPDYQLKLGILADGAGQRLEAQKRFTAALRSDPQLADQQLQSGKTKLKHGDYTGALATFGLSLKLFLLQLDNIALMPANVTTNDQRARIRESLTEHTFLVTTLGRNDYASVAAAAVDYARFEPISLCRMSLDRAQRAWNTDARLENAIGEIKARRLGLNDCRLKLGLPALWELEFAEWTDKALCRAALNAEFNLWGRWKDAVEEATRRSFTVDRCRLVLGLPPLAKADFREFAADLLCQLSLDSDQLGWGTLAEAVAEAKRRGFGLDDCRSLLKLPRLPELAEDVICRGALNSSQRRWSERDFVTAEAKRRGLTIAKCRSLLGLPVGLPTGLEHLADTSVCFGALDATKAGWGNFEMAVLEALSRGLAVNECRRYFSLPPLPQGGEGRYAYIKRADTYREAGDYEKAVREYTRAIAIDPRYGAAYLSRGDAYAYQDLYDRAIADYETIIQLEPSNARAYASRGFAHESKEEYEKAIADFEKAIELRPDYDYAYAGLGYVHYDKGDFSEALGDFNKAIEIDPKYTWAHRGRGLTYFARGDFQSAASDFQRVISTRQTDPYSHLWLEIVNRRRQAAGHLAEAVSQLDMKAWPAPLIRLFLGEINADQVFTLTKDSDAEKSRNQLCLANFYVGEFMLLEGSKAEAIRLLQLAETECPHHFSVWPVAKAELKALGSSP
jgi:predicted Zn-dependent protease